MAGTIMKTRRRVKRTVREMPRRLTIRLSKGSNNNMVEGPVKANAPLLRTNHSSQNASDATSKGTEGRLQGKTKSIPQLTSLKFLKLGNKQK